MKKNWLILPFLVLLMFNPASALWQNEDYAYRRTNNGPLLSNIILPTNGTYGSNMANSSTEYVYCVVSNGTHNTKSYYNNENDTMCADDNDQYWKVQTWPVSSETGVPLTNLYLWYPFDEDSGNPEGFGYLGNDAVNNGASFVSSVIRNGLFFNSGEDDYINTTWMPTLNFMSNNQTYAFWFKQGATPTYGALLGGRNPGQTGYWYIYMPYSGDEIRYRYVDNSGNQYLAYVNNDTIQDGSWHHIVISVNPDTQEMYVWVDGSSQTVTEVTQTNPAILTPTVFLLIGSWNNQGTPNTAEDLNATLDNFMIFNRSLTQAEVDALYLLNTSLGDQEELSITYGSWYPISQNYRKPVKVTNNDSFDHVYEPVIVNVTGTNLDGARCYEEVRLTECYPENSYSCVSQDLIEFDVISNTSTSCEIGFLTNVSANKWKYHYVYYDDDSGVNLNYTLHRMAYDTFETYADTSEMQVNWGDDPTDNGNVGWWLDTSSPIIGSKSLKYKVNASEQDSIHYNFSHPILDNSANGTVSFLLRTPVTVNTDAVGIALTQTTDRSATYQLVIDFGYPGAGDIAFNNATGWFDTGLNFNTNSVYLVKIYNVFVDYPTFANSKWSFSVNGSVAVEDTGDTNSNALTNMSTIQFWGWGTNEDTYLDNLQAWSHDFNVYDLSSSFALGSEEQSFSPQITLTSPTDNSTINVTNTTFYFNVTDADSSVTSCNLYLNASEIYEPTFTNLTNYSYTIVDGGYYTDCYNGKCYFFGGKNETGAFNTYRVFNISDQTWYELGNMTYPSVGAGVVKAPYCSGYEDIYFVFSNPGWSNCGGACYAMMYNISNDTFTDILEVPSGQVERGLWGNFKFDPCKLYYIAGGGYDGLNSANVSIYNILNDTWTTTSDTYPAWPTSGYEAGGYAIFNDSIINGSGDEFLLVVGGNWNQDTYDDVYWYYPHNTTWISKSPMPQYPNFGARGFSFGKIDNKFYVWQGQWADKTSSGLCPGGSVSGFMTYTLVYNPITDSWNTTAFHNFNNTGALTCRDGNTFYMLGGWTTDCDPGWPNYRSYVQKIEFFSNWKPVGSNSTSYTNQTSSIEINETLSFDSHYQWYVECVDDTEKTNTSVTYHFITSPCFSDWNNTQNVSSCFNSTNYRYDEVWVDENSCDPLNSTYNVTTYPALTYSYSNDTYTCNNLTQINNSYRYDDDLSCGYYYLTSNTTDCYVAACGDSTCEGSFKCEVGNEVCQLDYNETQTNCCTDCGVPNDYYSCVNNVLIDRTSYRALDQLGRGIGNFFSGSAAPIAVFLILVAVGGAVGYLFTNIGKSIGGKDADA